MLARLRESQYGLSASCQTLRQCEEDAYFRPTHDRGPKLKGMKLAAIFSLFCSNHLLAKTHQQHVGVTLLSATYRSGR